MKLSRDFFVQHKWKFKYVMVDTETECPVGYLDVRKDGFFCSFEMTSPEVDKFYISGSCSIGYVELRIETVEQYENLFKLIGFPS